MKKEKSVRRLGGELRGCWECFGTRSIIWVFFFLLFSGAALLFLAIAVWRGERSSRRRRTELTKKEAARWTLERKEEEVGNTIWIWWHWRRSWIANKFKWATFDSVYPIRHLCLCCRHSRILRVLGANYINIYRIGILALEETKKRVWIPKIYLLLPTESPKYIHTAPSWQHITGHVPWQ